MPDSATLPVWDALGKAIDVGANPPAGLSAARFYRNGEVPSKAPLSYFLLGQAPESEAGYYGQAGQEGRYRIHCWADTPSSANRLYQWLRALIHDRRLLLQGHTMIRGSLSKGGEVPDADGKAWQVPAEYLVETLEGLA